MIAHSLGFFKALLFVLFVLFVLSSAERAQSQVDWFPKGWGTQVGVSIGLGTHHSRIGLLARAFAHWEHIQVNLELAGFYQAQALGTQTQGFEGQFRAGVLGTWGHKNTFWENPFLRVTGNQTNRPYAVGYSFNGYWDNQKTSQCTGTFALQIRQFHLLMENDFLAFLNQDKYRTGALGLYFQQGSWQLALQQVSWTADPYAHGTRTITNDSIYKNQAKYGYRAMSGVRYSNRSAGVLRLKAVYHSPWADQEIGASLGIDAEQVRHGLQNKTIHDSFLLKNPHIPMIDSQGNAYLYQTGQKIRAPRFYGHALLNPLSLY
ncbi:MAG: polymorphic toxin type 23 domain-containing protein [Aureispira sp.]